MSGYWREVWTRAVSETRNRLSLTAGFVLRTVLVSGVGVFLAWWLGTWDNAVTTAVSLFIGVILANVVVFVAVLLVQVVRAPALIHSDQQSRMATLATALERFNISQEQRNSVRLRIARCKHYEAECLAKSDPHVLKTVIDEWVEDTQKLLSHELGDAGIGYLFHAAQENDYIPDPSEMRSHNMVADQYMLWLRRLRAKRRVLEEYSTAITPLAR
jgi:hypothetical protein